MSVSRIRGYDARSPFPPHAIDCDLDVPCAERPPYLSGKEGGCSTVLRLGMGGALRLRSSGEGGWSGVFRCMEDRRNDSLRLLFEDEMPGAVNGLLGQRFDLRP